MTLQIGMNTIIKAIESGKVSLFEFLVEHELIHDSIGIVSYDANFMY